MCEDFYGEDFRKTLAELFRSWKTTMLDFICSNEEIEKYDWIKGFFMDLRRILPELKGRSDYPDLFKVRPLYKSSTDVFEICFRDNIDWSLYYGYTKAVTPDKDKESDCRNIGGSLKNERTAD